MRPRWIILGLFLAGIVYGTIIWWPERPLWTAKVSKCSQLLIFSEDSKSIFILDERRDEINQPIKPHFCRWDALTGKLLSETPITVPEAFEWHYEISNDGSALIVRDAYPSKERPNNLDFWVIDCSSGQKHIGPLVGTRSTRAGPTFSRNGQWIVYSFENEKHPGFDGGIAVIDSITGNAIVRVAHTEHEVIMNACFSPDNSAIALFQRKEDGADFSIRIFDLPSGKERCRFPLMKRKWQFMDTWEDHHLIAYAEMPDPTGHESITKAYAIDLDSIPIGQEKERPEFEQRDNAPQAFHGEPLETNWREYKKGNNWRVEYKWGGNVELDWLRKYWNKCADWVRVKKVQKAALQHWVRVVDVDTNKVRFQLDDADSQFEMSVNGAFYCLIAQDELSVWNAQSYIRWPWALAASLGTMLLILLLGRWRSKRLSNSRS